MGKLKFILDSLTGGKISGALKEAKEIKKIKKEDFDRHYADYLGACKSLVEVNSTKENYEEKKEALCFYIRKKQIIFEDHLNPIWWATRGPLSKEDEDLEKKAFSIMETLVDQNGWPL